jgi:perosamine synthetase
MIPIYTPYLSKTCLKYAHDAIDSGWISSQGRYLDLAKDKLKEIIGCDKIILTNNGTSSTHLLSLALSIKYPQIKKILVPNNVYVAAWNSFLFNGKYELIPIDANLDTWNFDESKISKNLDSETAVLIVHNIGNVINVPLLKKLYPNTIFLEDNCEGFLGKYESKYTGTESFVSSVSFFGNKTITSGEGGAFMTNDEEIFNTINIIKNQGQSDIKFLHNHLGYNYRMTNIQAAILYGQLMELDIITEKKKNIFLEYRKNLESIEEINFQKINQDTIHSNWMFGIRLNNFNLQKKKDLELFLFKSGIDTRPMFYDITKHKYLNTISCETKNAEILQSQCLILPSYPDLTKSQISYICNKIKSFLNNEK